MDVVCKEVLQGGGGCVKIRGVMGGDLGMVSPRGREYARRRFLGMGHADASVGLYASAESGGNSFRAAGGRAVYQGLQERADASVLEAAERIRADSLASLRFLQGVRDGEVVGNEGENVLATRVRAAEFLLGSAGLGPVKRSEVRGVVGVVDAEFLARLKGLESEPLEVEGEEGTDECSQVSDVC